MTPLIFADADAIIAILPPLLLRYAMRAISGHAIRFTPAFIAPCR